MMRRYGLVPLVLCAVLLCSASVVCAEGEPSAQSDADAKTGTLYVYRLGANGQVSATIRLGTTEIGRLTPNTFFRSDLAPGPYVIIARSPTNAAKRTVQVEAGKTSYVEQSFVVDFRAFRRVRLVPRDEADGAAAVDKLAPAKRFSPKD